MVFAVSFGPKGQFGLWAKFIWVLVWLLLRNRRNTVQNNYSVNVNGSPYFIFFASKIFWSSNMFKNSIVMFR